MYHIITLAFVIAAMAVGHWFGWNARRKHERARVSQIVMSEGETLELVRRQQQLN